MKFGVKVCRRWVRQPTSSNTIVTPLQIQVLCVGQDKIKYESLCEYYLVFSCDYVIASFIHVTADGPAWPRPHGH